MIALISTEFAVTVGKKDTKNVNPVAGNVSRPIGNHKTNDKNSYSKTDQATTRKRCATHVVRPFTQNETADTDRKVDLQS